jgi:uncharacterized protein
MQALITQRLLTIAQEQHLKILFACESGSRGWEFPSPDSDYDVRFIYVRPYKFYLSVMDRDYDVQFPIEGDLDMYGWDIRKVLQLIRKSNTTPFEWLQSPIVYIEQPGFRESLWDLCRHYFSQRANIHHYLGIAKGAMDTLENGDQIKIKKLFYVLRPLLAAKWCLEKNSIAPMTIDPLMTLLPADLLQTARKLITLKATAEESFVIKIDQRLLTYIQTEYMRINEASVNLQRDHFEPGALDDFFAKTITRYDH